MMAKFRNAGQTCISANRLFVHKSLSNTFTNKLVNRLKKLKVGDGMKDNDIGPLISNEALKNSNWYTAFCDTHRISEHAKCCLISFLNRERDSEIRPNRLLPSGYIRCTFGGFFHTAVLAAGWREVRYGLPRASP